MSTETDDSGELAALGRRLREAREYLNLSQQYVSDKTGIPRSAISDIERGQRKVDSLELKKFSKLYVHPVDYFLGSEEGDPDMDAWDRTVVELTEADRAEVLRFAQFLRFSADAERRTGRR
ncbi:MAG: helix-turn-helix domain-containing protein [Pseudonocardia sp.]